jgi:hypothetical protein
MSVRLRSWQAVALAGGLAALLAGAVGLTQPRPGPDPAGGQVPLGRTQPVPFATTRLLVARGAAGRQQLVSVDLRSGARRTVRLPELRPGRRRLAELTPLAGGAVAGVVADDAEWSPASTTLPPEPRVYAWPGSDFDRPGRLLGRATETYPSAAPGRLWLSTASVRGGVTTFTVRELDTQGRQTSPPRSLGPLPLGAGLRRRRPRPHHRAAPGWRPPRPGLGGAGRRAQWPPGPPAGAGRRHHGHRPGPPGGLQHWLCPEVGPRAVRRRRPGVGGACAALSVANVETGRRWHAVDGRGCRLWAVAARSPSTTSMAGTMMMAKAPPRMLTRYRAPAILASRRG